MTDYVTPTTWEQCAAHVEAGGVVEIEDAPGVWINDRAAATTYRGRCGTPDDGWAPRRLVPIESAAPAPESSTGIGEGEAVRAYYRPTAERLRAISEVMTAERLRDEAAAPAAGDDLRERIARAIYEEEHDGPWKNANLPDWVQSLRSADAVLAVLPPQPAPSPVPPWPGAVLSGLCDEDGVPTWLAQAGQVRGEQVRRRSDFVWVNNDQMVAHLDTVWVEVRAPRAEPEPETERVPWWEAVEDDRDVTAAQGGPTFSAWLRLRDPEGDWWLVVNGCTDLATAYKQKIAPDGTVEVLKDGGR